MASKHKVVSNCQDWSKVAAPEAYTLCTAYSHLPSTLPGDVSGGDSPWVDDTLQFMP
jgi:hypothetical protein